jgi:hypothetical protein
VKRGDAVDRGASDAREVRHPDGPPPDSSLSESLRTRSSVCLDATHIVVRRRGGQFRPHARSVDLGGLVAELVVAIPGDHPHRVALLDAEVAPVQPGVGPGGVGAVGEGFAGEAAVGLIVELGVEVGAHDRGRGGADA